MLSDAIKARIKEIWQNYPEEENRAPLLMAMHAAQDEYGWLSEETLEELAAYLGLEPIKVYEAATFYEMFNLERPGRHHIRVCTNISCWLCGSDEVVEHLHNRLGIGVGETTEDGRFSLTEVECLGACGGAPMFWIDRTYYEDLTPQKIDEILACLD